MRIRVLAIIQSVSGIVPSISLRLPFPSRSKMSGGGDIFRSAFVWDDGSLGGLVVCKLLSVCVVIRTGGCCLGIEVSILTWSLLERW